MSDPGEQGKADRGFLPYTYIVGRLLIVVPTLLIIIFVCAGFAGWGPGHRLHGAAAVPAAHWVTGKQPAHHRRHRRRRHHRHHHHKRHHHGHSKRHGHRHHRRGRREGGQSG